MRAKGTLAFRILTNYLDAILVSRWIKSRGASFAATGLYASSLFPYAMCTETLQRLCGILLRPLIR